jgi:hypothetical protein
MNAEPRRAFGDLSEGEIPKEPGVYAIYRGGAPQYIGKAKSLRSRLWKNHCRRGASMTNSALRRNVAELLGIASADDIKTGRYRTTAATAQRVSAWLSSCEVTWIACKSEAAAIDLENAMKRERRPPLTKL